MRFKFSSVRIPILLASGALGMLFAKSASDAQEPRLVPATQQIDTKLYTRQMEDLRAVGARQAAALGGAGNVPAILADDSKRAAHAPGAIPILNERLLLIDKIAPTKTMPDMTIAEMRLNAQALLYLLNDGDTTARVDRAQSTNLADERFAALSIKLLARFLESQTDSVQTDNLVDELQGLNTSNPAQPQLAILTFAVYRLNISDEFEVRLRKVLSNTLSSPAAADAKAIIEAETKSRADLLKRVKAASAEMKAMEGKPITIIGKTPDGKDFTSADWKGKVVMADFWATWCGPCLVGLPEVKAQYKKYHDRGFEIIGVSDDSDAKTLTAFIARNEMPWPQLFDPHFNPTKGALLVQQYHVMGIPTLFLIDKKGNLRTVDARKSMEELIPKLLAESAE